MNFQKRNSSLIKNNSIIRNNSVKSNTRNYGKSIRNAATPDSYGKVIFFVVLLLIIGLIIYIIYVAVSSAKKESKNSPIIVASVIDAYVARKPVKLPKVIIGMNQSFSTWIYIKDWTYKFGQYKNILWKGNPESDAVEKIHCPSMWLYPLNNSLKVVTSTSDVSGVESCDISNIPLMTWVHIAYVLKNRTVDIYINGKLERSCALRGIPKITDDPVYMSAISTSSPTTKKNNNESKKKQQAGFYGKIGKTQYFVKALLPNDVANLYQQGPLGKSQYQMQFFDKEKQKGKKDSSDSITSNDSKKRND